MENGRQTVTIEQLRDIKDKVTLCSHRNPDSWKRLEIEVQTDKNEKANASYHITNSNGFNKRCSFLKKAIEYYNEIY